MMTNYADFWFTRDLNSTLRIFRPLLHKMLLRVQKKSGTILTTDMENMSELEWMSAAEGTTIQVL